MSRLPESWVQTLKCRTGRIAILTGNHLCNNPRVIKEATTLAKRGYVVSVLGAWLDASLAKRDRELTRTLPFEFKPVLDSGRRHSGALVPRVRAKLGSIAQRTLGYQNPWQLGYAYPNLLRAALRESADLFIAHSEQAMAVAVRLWRSGRNVAVDMEDWYSRDLLPEATRYRPVALIERLERELLSKGCLGLCPSQAMADALSATYGCARPTPIYNAFPWQDRERIDGKFKDRQDRSLPSLHWFSQTLGPGRGLDVLIRALPKVRHRAELHLRGQPTIGFRRWLETNLPASWLGSIFLHDPVPNDELLSRISEHDIGLACEQPFCDSRDLTVTNKILQYLQAGLAVVASDTKGQCEVARVASGAVHLYQARDSLSLAVHLNALLSDSALLASSKQAALLAAKETFCWEAQAGKLLEIYADALGRIRSEPA